MSLPRLIEATACVNASSSEKDYPFTNLTHGVSGHWASSCEQPLPAYLNFDLKKNYLLEKIRVTVPERESAPWELCLDYFGNDLKLIGNNIAKFKFDAPDDDFDRSQDFLLDCQVYSVMFIRIRILSTWGGKSVKIRGFNFYGNRCDKGVKKFAEKASSDAEWYIGDRVRYLGPDGKKWCEGRILHINPADTTYLIQDDHGWVKDHIKPKDTRKPRYSRKPRKLKASTSQISVQPIVEEKEEHVSDSSDSSESSYDEAPFVMKEELEITKNALKTISEEKSTDINEAEAEPQIKIEEEEIPQPSVKSKAVLAKGFSKDVLNGVYTRSPNLMGGRPMFKDGGGRVIWWYKDVKSWMICMAHLVGTDRAYACVQDSAMHPADIQSPWCVFIKAKRLWIANRTASVTPFNSCIFNVDDEKEDIPETVIAQDFRKGVNGIYKMTSATLCGRPMYQALDMKIVLWWYLKMRMWMFSPAKHVGTEKCFCFSRDHAMYPYNVKAEWRSWTSKKKAYLPDAGKVIAGEASPFAQLIEKHEDLESGSEVDNMSADVKPKMIERMTSSGPIALYLSTSDDDIPEKSGPYLVAPLGIHKPIHKRSSSNPKLQSETKNTENERPRRNSLENVATSILRAKKFGGCTDV